MGPGQRQPGAPDDPGLALFYGGMVRAKSALNMMMMSFGAIGVVSVLWVLYGYSLAFSNDVGGGLLGGARRVPGLQSLLGEKTARAAAMPDDGVRRLPGHVRHHHGRR